MKGYCDIVNGVVENIFLSEEEYAKEQGWVYIQNASIGDFWDGVTLSRPPYVGTTQDEYINYVQSFLDLKAREKNYDNILSACSYATSKNPVFSAEGQACVNWRDDVWSYCYQLLEKVKSGEIKAPSFIEIKENLPKLNWPN